MAYDDYSDYDGPDGCGDEGFGDARTCPHHPGVVTSSPDGLIDGLCGFCESESEIDNDAAELAYLDAQAAEALAVMATPEWQAEAARRQALRDADPSLFDDTAAELRRERDRQADLDDLPHGVGLLPEPSDAVVPATDPADVCVWDDDIPF